MHSIELGNIAANLWGPKKYSHLSTFSLSSHNRDFPKRILSKIGFLKIKKIKKEGLKNISKIGIEGHFSFILKIAIYIIY